VIQEEERSLEEIILARRLELLEISRLPPEERPPEPLSLTLGPNPAIADIVRNRRMRHLAVEAEARRIGSI
jgi:hypothetical protein